MAFRPTPSWLDASPDIYLKAITSGAEAGLGAARLSQQERESAARRAIAEDELAVQTGLAAERLRQQREIADQENATRIQVAGAQGERADRALEQGMGLRRDRLGLDTERAGDLSDYRTRQNDIREEFAGGRPNVADSAMRRDLMRAEAEAARLTATAKAISGEKLVDPTLKMKANSAAAGARARADSLRRAANPGAEPEGMQLETEGASAAPGGSQNPFKPYARFNGKTFELVK